MKHTTNSNTKLFIKTASADGIIDQDKQIYVKLVGGYVRKSAQDLQPGDLVVVRKDCINKKIDDVLPVIREGSMMYRLAEDRLYRSPKTSDDPEKSPAQDLRKPLLSVLLLEGLTRDSLESKETLESKIYGIAGQGFTTGEYTDFANKVHTVLREGLISRGKNLDHLVSIDTIKAWLKGETLAPKYWENLECLSEINSEFEVELHEERAGLNLRSAYDFAMQARRVVMDRLLHATTTAGPLNGEGSNGHKKYTLETRLAVAQLIDSVDATTMASRITSIEPEQRTKEKRDPKMERAIYTGPLDVPFIPMNDVRNTSYLLGEALYSLLERYALQKILETANGVLKEAGLDVNSFDTNDSLLDAVNTRFKEKGFGITLDKGDKVIPLRYLKELIPLIVIEKHESHNKRLMKADTYYITTGEFFERLVRVCPKEAYVNKRNRKILERAGQSTRELEITLDWMYREFNSTLTEQPGWFKRATGVNANEFYALVDLVNRYNSALPKRFLQREIEDIQASMNYCDLKRLCIAKKQRVERRNKRNGLNVGIKKYQKTTKQLKREYGLEDQEKRLFLSCLIDPKKGISTYEDHWKIRLFSISELHRRKEELEREDTAFYRRAEVAQILETLGIPSIIRAYDATNFLELFPKPVPAFGEGSSLKT